ncbi:MAG: DMT family transporter [Polyangia bacterium]|jgi:drug/metabolite transporter (DMT)-like permease|nr:DMT family transporter [Polyangia bacterium]
MAAPRHAWFWLILGLVTASQSGNIIRIGEAEPVAIAFWRVALALVVLVPLSLSQTPALFSLGRRGWLLLLASGLALAAHWLTWIAAVQRTTIANASVLFAANPVLLATAGHFLFGERVGRLLLASIGLGVSGVIVMSVGNFRINPDQWVGDLLAILTAVFFAMYFLAGKVLRRSLPGRIYVSSIYLVACFFFAVVLVAQDLPVIRYDGRTWLCFVGMALLPTLLGHTGLNIALKYFDVGRLSVSTLSEPLLAGLVAWIAWSEALTIQTSIGYLLICGSVVLLAIDQEPWSPARPTRSHQEGKDNELP